MIQLICSAPWRAITAHTLSGVTATSSPDKLPRPCPPACPSGSPTTNYRLLAHLKRPRQSYNQSTTDSRCPCLSPSISSRLLVVKLYLTQLTKVVRTRRNIAVHSGGSRHVLGQSSVDGTARIEVAAAVRVEGPVTAAVRPETVRCL